MDDTLIVNIGKLAVVGTDNATGYFSTARFTGNTMGGNIINIRVQCRSQTANKRMHFVDADNAAQIRCVLTSSQAGSCHSTVALNIIYITDLRHKSIPIKSTGINARNTACYSIRTGDNRTLVIAVSNTAVVFAYQATNITAIAFHSIAIAGNIADGAAVIFCCYSANAVTSIFACEYGRGNVYVFNYRTSAQLAKEATVSLQADNRMTIAIKCSRKFYIASTNSIIGALAICIYQAAGIYIIFQDVIIA